MEKTNKDIIRQLTDYFMKQNQEQTCKLLASMFIDLNRIVNRKKLGADELAGLELRINWNIKQLNKFIKDGPDGDLILENLDS